MICAMPIERAAAPSHWDVVVCGPGLIHASRATESALARSRPDLVVSAGTCGALRAAQALGEVYSIRKVLCEEESFIAHDLGGPPATLWSQDRIAVTAAEKAALAARGGDLVDMEAAAVARACQLFGVPFAAVKAVSDLASEDMPLDFNRYRRLDGGFHLPSIAFAGMMKIRGLLRLQRQTRLAVEKLGIALANARV
jgi:adenosylhomocysteine nucleosidase